MQIMLVPTIAIRNNNNLILRSRATGAGGIIYKLGGHIVTNYAWGLGTLTNNEAKASAVYASIKLTLSHQISNLIICGDLMLVIRSIIHENITR